MFHIFTSEDVDDDISCFFMFVVIFFLYITKRKSHSGLKYEFYPCVKNNILLTRYLCS